MQQKPQYEERCSAQTTLCLVVCILLFAAICFLKAENDKLQMACGRFAAYAEHEHREKVFFRTMLEKSDFPVETLSAQPVEDQTPIYTNEGCQAYDEMTDLAYPCSPPPLSRYYGDASH